MILCSNFLLQFLERDTRTVNLHPPTKHRVFAPLGSSVYALKIFWDKNQRRLQAFALDPDPFDSSWRSVKPLGCSGFWSFDQRGRFMRANAPTSSNGEVIFEVPSSEVPIVPRLEATEQPTPQTHVDGNCAPCVFFTSQHGCMHGCSCHYCHMPHEENSCPRPRKQTRDKIKDRIRQLFISLYRQACQSPWWVAFLKLRTIRGYLDEIAITWEGFDLEARWRRWPTHHMMTNVHVVRCGHLRSTERGLFLTCLAFAYLYQNDSDNVIKIREYVISFFRESNFWPNPKSCVSELGFLMTWPSRKQMPTCTYYSLMT